MASLGKDTQVHKKLCTNDGAGTTIWASYFHNLNNMILKPSFLFGFKFPHKAVFLMLDPGQGKGGYLPKGRAILDLV